MCYNAIVKDLHFHFPFRRSRLTIEFVGGFCLPKMSINQAKANIAKGLDIWGSPLPKK